MKPFSKLLLLGALGLGLAGSAGFAQTDTNQAPAEPPPPPPPGHHLSLLLTNLLDKYDVNKDGILDQTELATLKQDVADGKLPPPPQMRGPRGPGAPGMGPPPRLDAKQVLLKFDANKDGVLDETELAAFLKDMQAHRPPHPPGPSGPGGPGGPPPPDAPAEAPQQ